MKNELEEKKKGTKKYRKSIRRSITIEKMFLDPSTEKQGLVFGDKSSIQKNKVFKDMNMDMKDEYMHNNRETNQDKNMLTKQTDKIKNLINNFMNEVLCDEEKSENSPIKAEPKKTHDRRISTVSMIAHQTINNLDSNNQKRKAKNVNFNVEDDNQGNTKKENNPEHGSNTKKSFLNRKQTMKHVDTNDHGINGKNNADINHPNHDSNENKNKKKVVFSKNYINESNSKNDTPDNENQIKQFKKNHKLDGIDISSKRHSIMVKTNDKFFKKIYNISNNKDQSDSDSSRTDQVDSPTNELDSTSPNKNSKNVNTHLDIDKTHSVSNRKKSFLKIISSNNKQEFLEEKMNIMNKNKSPTGNDLNSDKKMDENGDLFNVALNSIIKKKFINKDNHISNRSESPLVDNVKINQESNGKNITTNVSSNRYMKVDNNNNINNQVENPEKGRNIRKLNVVCDSLSEDEEELELATITNSCCLIYPDSIFKETWEWMILSINLYFMLMTPFYVAFGLTIPKFVIGLEYLFEALYILDVILNFFIPFKDFDENTVLNHKFIIAEYLTSWFLIDLISAFPANSLLLYSSLFIFSHVYGFS